jgi:hypothetical protein
MKTIIVIACMAFLMGCSDSNDESGIIKAPNGNFFANGLTFEEGGWDVEYSAWYIMERIKIHDKYVDTFEGIWKLANTHEIKQDEEIQAILTYLNVEREYIQEHIELKEMGK